jgi:DNA-3-methyladenine glycosylase II
MAARVDYTIALATLKQADPILAAVIEQVGDCRLDQAQQSGEVLDAIARSIIYQQLSTKSATAIYHRFLALYPSQLLSAIDLLNTPDDTLRSVGLSRPKVRYLKDLAQQVLNGLPPLPELETMSDEAIIQTLLPIQGVGRWTVEMLLIFRLHRWDVLPVDDLGVRAAIKQCYELPELPMKQTVLQIGQAWQPYRSIATWYLWRSLELKPR